MSTNGSPCPGDQGALIEGRTFRGCAQTEWGKKRARYSRAPKSPPHRNLPVEAKCRQIQCGGMRDHKRNRALNVVCCRDHHSAGSSVPCESER